jgi:aspartate/methionine/tyrosine aminotransferase
MTGSADQPEFLSSLLDGAASWSGKFPRSGIISLLDVNSRFNLAESTASDLTLGELVEIVGWQKLKDLKLGYGSSAGNPTLRTQVAQLCAVSPDDVLVTQGAALGLFLFAFELCRPEDEVVLVTPYFPPSHDALVGCGARVRTVPLHFDEAYRLDPAKVAAELSPATRLVSLASPQNPSGIRIPRDVVRAILDAMAARAPQARLFVDETYRLTHYAGASPEPSVASLDSRVVTAASVSKSHGAPGLRVGWMTVRDPQLRERLTVAKMNTVISGSPLNEVLATGLLTRQEAVLEPRSRMLATALDMMARWHSGEAHRVDWLRPDAGALCCMRLSRAVFDAAAVERFWMALPRHDLQLAPGDWFGEERRIFRLGFGYLPLQDFAAALAALSRALDEAAPFGPV